MCVCVQHECGIVVSHIVSVSFLTHTRARTLSLFLSFFSPHTLSFPLLFWECLSWRFFSSNIGKTFFAAAVVVAAAATHSVFFSLYFSFVSRLKNFNSIVIQMSRLSTYWKWFFYAVSHSLSSINRVCVCVFESVDGKDIHTYSVRAHTLMTTAAAAAIATITLYKIGTRAIPHKPDRSLFHYYYFFSSLCSFWVCFFLPTLVLLFSSVRKILWLMLRLSRCCWWRCYCCCCWCCLIVAWNLIYMQIFQYSQAHTHTHILPSVMYHLASIYMREFVLWITWTIRFVV